tara:strand:- start:1142 stop:3133 length:1992 start_codon:yes stop_codon:yes gene_type:complete
MGIKESAKEYHNLGLSLVAMESGSKAPKSRNWQDQGVDVEKLTDSQNIGVIHNLSSTCSLDIDDREDAIKVFQEYLGIDAVEMKNNYPCWRGKREGIKFLFRMPDINNIGIKKLTYKKGTEVVTVFELRGSTTGTGVQDLMPPSLHPSGIPYEWVNPLPQTFKEIPILPERLKELWENWDTEEPAMLHCLGKFKPEIVKRSLPSNEDSIDIIEQFNKTYSVTEILEKNGYTKKGSNRFLSPHSSSKIPGIVLLDDGSIYSHHGGDTLGDGKAHDAFDVARILEANSDWKTAFNNARSDLGIEQVIYKKPIDVRAFKFFHASEAIDNATPPKWIIKNVLEEDSLIGMFGSPKTGKSFITVDMACAVATGKEWHEKRTKQGLVLYLAGEGHRGLSRRLLAWEQVNKQSLKDSKLHYSERGVQILDDLDAEMMRNEALVLQDTYKEAPKLVVIDTLARNFGAGNENSTEDMNRFVANCDRFIREEFRCGVILVHHTGHGENSRGRGSSVLPAALDAEYKVIKNEDPSDRLNWTIDLEQSLIKDGRGMSPMRFRFQETEFHHLLDEEGTPTTSGALKTDLYIAPKKEKKLGGNQQLVLDSLHSVYARKVREARSAGTDVHEVFVTQKELRDESGIDIYHPKNALINDHKMMIEDKTGEYTPVDKELF